MQGGPQWADIPMMQVEIDMLKDDLSDHCEALALAEDRIHGLENVNIDLRKELQVSEDKKEDLERIIEDLMSTANQQIADVTTLNSNQADLLEKANLELRGKSAALEKVACLWCAAFCRCGKHVGN